MRRCTAICEKIEAEWSGPAYSPECAAERAVLYWCEERGMWGWPSDMVVVVTVYHESVSGWYIGSYSITHELTVEVDMTPTAKATRLRR